jgi:hypothetical protein
MMRSSDDGERKKALADLDWATASQLMERQDDGSDMYVGFNALRSGPLAELVRVVSDMPTKERARLVIDAGTAGTFNVGDILALAKRDDFPG